MADPYQKHRVALAPFIGCGDASVENGAAQLPKTIPEEAFVAFLIQQGLAPLWHHLLTRQRDLNAQPGLSDHSIEALSGYRQEAAAHYLLQKAALPEIKQCLDTAQITHVIYKGVAERELHYAHPALRPAADIDLLVSPNHRDAAITALTRTGFALRTNAANISHEVNLQRGALTIDLHWDILRPGRTRVPMADVLLESREERGDHWALSPAGALFVALVHPVFAKYATAPQATLIRLLDLHYALEHAEAHLDQTLNLLEQAGLKAAAWIMLTHLEQLSSPNHYTAAGASLRAAATPEEMRKTYLIMWLRYNLPTKLQRLPSLIQLGFTAAAHDRISDFSTAFTAMRHARITQDAALRETLSAADINRTAGPSAP